MQTTPRVLMPAQHEVHRTAHDQDLVEVPRRARLDREAERRKAAQDIQNGTTPDEGRNL